MPPSVILSVLDQYINLINKYRFEAIILVSIAHFVIFPNIQLQQLIQYTRSQSFMIRVSSIIIQF